MKVSFGAIVGMARGKLGGVVATKAKNGATFRLRVRGANPNTAAQSAVRASLTDASRAYKALSSSAAQDWIDYANSLTRTDPITGSSYHPSAISIFVALGTKFLQVDPGGSIPTTPPATPFDGDDITVTTVGAADKVTFTGSADNAAGVTTELLLQKLPSGNVKPKPNGYRSYGFKDDLDTTPFDVTPLSEGVWSSAYRFVETATGQQTGIVVLPNVTVT